VGIGHALRLFEAAIVDGGEAVRFAEGQEELEAVWTVVCGCPWQRASSRRNTAQSARWSEVAAFRVLVVDAVT
jgi:hypothetical protein